MSSVEKLTSLTSVISNIGRSYCPTFSEEFPWGEMIIFWCILIVISRGSIDNQMLTKTADGALMRHYGTMVTCCRFMITSHTYNVLLLHVTSYMENETFCSHALALLFYVSTINNRCKGKGLAWCTGTFYVYQYFKGIWRKRFIMQSICSLLDMDVLQIKIDCAV